MLLHRPVRNLFVAVLGLTIALAPTACSSKKTPRARRTQPTVVRSTPSVLRGTIGTEVTFDGVDPTLVSGYGLVVGLNGTGGTDLPDGLAAHMERELGLKGIGKSLPVDSGALTDPVSGQPKSPRQVLRDPNTAVVVVYALIPPGSPDESEFDVYVRALDTSEATSLEGGLLWTTDLRIGPPTIVGGRQTRRLAQAYGPVFINPFAEPGAEDTVNRRIGRILGGGRVSDPLKIGLRLTNPSHARARAIASAINSRFPEGARSTGPTARGKSDELVALSVPGEYRDDPVGFLSVVRHIRVDYGQPQIQVHRYLDALKREPGMADELSWCLEGLGRADAVVRNIRTMYKHPEQSPRLAAVRAGSRLGDARSADPLMDIARNGQPADRLVAVHLLSRLNAGPTVDLFLRELLAETDLDIRIGAYEGLAWRAEQAQLARLLAAERTRPRAAGAPVGFDDLRALSRLTLPAGTIQGVYRESMEGKFYLDVVPVGDPLIYITQQGTPRIVLFGEHLELSRPLFVSAWSDRLMLAADSPTDGIRLYYSDYRDGSVTVDTLDSASLHDFVRYAAHTSTPEEPAPGLGLSYSEVVGALHRIHAASGIDAGFATERDKLLAGLLKAQESGVVEDRPETTDGEREIVVFEQVERVEGRDEPTGKSPSLVEPLPNRGTETLMRFPAAMNPLSSPTIRSRSEWRTLDSTSAFDRFNGRVSVPVA